MTKLCPKIILEGTRLTHKTDIAFALNSHPRILMILNWIASKASAPQPA